MSVVKLNSMPKRPSPIVDGKKQCATCGEWKPTSEFWLYLRMDRPQDPKIPRANCKACSIVANQTRRRAASINRRSLIPRPKEGHRFCSDCKKELPISSFGTVPSRGNQILSRCKQCSYERQKQWRSSEIGHQKLLASSRSRPRSKEQERAYRATPEYKAAHKRRMSAWMEINGDRYRASVRERSKKQRVIRAEKDKAWRKEYLKTERGKANVSRYVHKRRMAIESKLSTLTAEEWAQIKSSQCERCAYCREVKRLTMDHVIPISRGGVHTKENVVGACMPCNLSKSNKLLSEWNRPARCDHGCPKTE